MAYDLNYVGSTDDETSYVAWLMQLFSQARTRRVNFEPQWEESAAICWPEYRNSFAFGHVRPPGMKYTEYQIDTTGSIAAHRFMALADAMITPWNKLWSRVRPDNKDLLKERNVALYYDKLSDVLWNQRYRPEANFFSQNQLNWQCKGVFGNHGMIIDEYDSRPGEYRPGIRYCATSPGEIYILRNHQGRENGFIRHFRWPARQAALKFGQDRLGPVLQAALQKPNLELFDFLQFVLPNTEYDPMQIFAPVNGKPWVSCYVSVMDYCILQKGGYRSYPRSAGGYMRAPEEDYDRGPAQMVLPTLKTLNAIAAMFLRQGHKAAEPAYLLTDEGVTDLKTFPNARNYGGLGPAGEELVKLLATGQIQITEEMIARLEKPVQDAFLTTFFPLLQPPDQRPTGQNARQVIEDVTQRGLFLTPTLGSAFSDYLPMMVDRELDLLAYMSVGKSDRERAARGLLPKAPPVIAEAEGEYKLQFNSPLARAPEGEGIAAYYRMIEQTQNMIQAGAPPALLNRYDFDASLPEIAESTFVPSRWMATDEKVAAMAKAQAQAAERDRQVKELPGKAAIMKAQAISSKAATGQNTGGTLSGVPQGQMPMMPGQAGPGGSAFGQPGAQ